MGPTERQREILRHALGLNRSRKPYRDHYYTKAADPELEGMVSMGLMKRAGIVNRGRNQHYFVTEAGASVVDCKLP